MIDGGLRIRCACCRRCLASRCRERDLRLTAGRPESHKAPRLLNGKCERPTVRMSDSNSFHKLVALTVWTVFIPPREHSVSVLDLGGRKEHMPQISRLGCQLTSKYVLTGKIRAVHWFPFSVSLPAPSSSSQFRVARSGKTQPATLPGRLLLMLPWLRSHPAKDSSSKFWQSHAILQTNGLRKQRHGRHCAREMPFHVLHGLSRDARRQVQHFCPLTAVAWHWCLDIPTLAMLLTRKPVPSRPKGHDSS